MDWTDILSIMMVGMSFCKFRPLLRLAGRTRFSGTDISLFLLVPEQNPATVPERELYLQE